MISIYNRYTGNRGNYYRADGGQETAGTAPRSGASHRPPESHPPQQNRRPPAEKGGSRRLDALFESGGISRLLKGFLPQNIDTGDLLLLLVFLLLYLESEDEDFLIILIVLGLSIFRE